MGIQVCGGASIMCTFGVAPSTMIPMPGRPLANGMPASTIADIGFPPFGVCTSIINPAVAAATAAALGVLTPMPCVPAPVSPWAPGAPTVLIGGVPALTQGSVCVCAFGGSISVLVPGQMTVMVG